MVLNIKERFLLLGLMPDNSGSLAERRIIRNLASKLALSEKEQKEVGYIQEQVEYDGVPRLIFRWNPEKDAPVEVEVTEEVKLVLKEIVKQVEADKKVNDENFELLDKLDSL